LPFPGLLRAAYFLLLFLFGLHWMSRSLARSAGASFKSFLQRMTRTPWRGFLTGFLVTALLQSSSLTTVMVVSLTNAGMITTAQGWGVIIGANVGTTITGQLLSFNPGRLAWLLLGAALLLALWPHHPGLRRAAAPLGGCALLLLGLEGMTAALSSLREAPFFSGALQCATAAPWRGLLAGIFAAVLLQSSSAVVGIVLGLARGGLVTLPVGVSMVIGADLGTCSTALIAAVGMKGTARRAAWFHLLFNLISLLLALTFYPYLLQAALRSAATLPRRLANAHLLYNLLGAAVLLPLAGPLARLLEPDKPPS
jgi:phosphate:Na+ symporter